MHTDLGISIHDWSQRFTVLADPTRLALLAHMHHAGLDHDHRGQLTVAELAERCAISRNAASQALRALRELGWITADKDPADSRAVRYKLTDDTVHTILHSVMGATHDHHHAAS